VTVAEVAQRRARSVDGSGLTVLAVVSDAEAQEILSKVLGEHELLLARDSAHGLALAQTERPDVAFVDVGLGDGAGLAMVHHVKALAPEATVFALATPMALEAGAHAVALGGAGLIMLPLGGDEVLNAVASVRAHRAERDAREKLERAASLHARAAGWISRVAELAEAQDRGGAARHLVDVLAEATGASGAAVYLALGEGATELARTHVTPSLERAPAFGAEMDVLAFAREARLLVVPLVLRKIGIGHVLLESPVEVERADAAVAPVMDGLLRLLAAQAATAFAFLAERDQASGGGAIKDPSSSAYSFAYYVDVAGREIDKARRHGRRFSIATVALETAGDDAIGMRAAEVADHLLKAARDIDVLARVDESEFHFLLPEADGVGAHACRRRVLARFAQAVDRKQAPRGLLVGVATFPHDGQNLSQLLRVARRRADATRESIVHRIGIETNGLGDLLDALEWDAPAPAEPSALSAARPFELPIPEAVALAAAAVTDALRGGAAFVAVAHHPELHLGAAVRAAVGPVPAESVVLHAIDLRGVPDGQDVEALAVVAEHGAYALVGRSKGGVVRGVHAADPLLVDLVAERLGRAAGLRIFG
jgi:ActR/RegA family two-component response regulator/GGDEF domain-containing protein